MCCARVCVQVELSEERRLDLEGQLATFQEQLRDSPDSSEALEGAAVINARLGNFQVCGRAAWGCTGGSGIK